MLLGSRGDQDGGDSLLSGRAEWKRVACGRWWRVEVMNRHKGHNERSRG